MAEVGESKRQEEGVKDEFVFSRDAFNVLAGTPKRNSQGRVGSSKLEHRRKVTGLEM